MSLSYLDFHTLLLRRWHLFGSLWAAGKSFRLRFERSGRSSRRYSRRSRKKYRRWVALLKKNPNQITQSDRQTGREIQR